MTNYLVAADPQHKAVAAAAAALKANRHFTRTDDQQVQYLKELQALTATVMSLAKEIGIGYQALAEAKAALGDHPLNQAVFEQSGKSLEMLFDEAFERLREQQARNGRSLCHKAPAY